MAEEAPIDGWSRAALAALADWADGLGGVWVRAGGRPVLRLEAEGGDRLSIHAEDQELVVSIGLWEQALPEEGGGAADPVEAVDQAKALVGAWLDGALVIAEFFDAAGRWCGALAIRPREEAVEAQLSFAAGALVEFAPSLCQVRAARGADTRRFGIRDGQFEPV